MTDIIERLRDWMAVDQTTSPASRMAEAADTIQRLRQQLSECQARERVLRVALRDFVVACDPTICSGAELSAYHKAKKTIALPSDSTALDEVIKQAKREVLLEAADFLFKDGQHNHWAVKELRRMAEELK